MVKKMILMILPIMALSTAIAQTPKTIKAAWEIQQAADKKVNARIDSLVHLFPAQQEDKIDTPISQPSKGNIESYVSAYYTSSNIFTEASGVVTGLKAVKGVNLPYVGLAAPTLERPFLANGEIVFRNQPDANFKIQVRDNKNPYPLPEEVTIIFRKMPGTNYEALYSGWGNYYIGFAAIDDLRALRSDTYFSKKSPLKYFELSFIHVRYEDAGNGKGKAKAWVNGIYVGEIVTPDADWPRRLGYGVGIETNSTDFNWLASMFIERGMTDSEREAYFKEIQNAYKIGSLPALPYASDIKIVEQSGKLTASYKYNGADAENKSKVEYQWYKLSPNLGSQKLISTESSITKQSGVKVCVKVTDVKGNSWMYVSGIYN